MVDTLGLEDVVRITRQIVHDLRVDGAEALRLPLGDVELRLAVDRRGGDSRALPADIERWPAELRERVERSVAEGQPVPVSPDARR